MYRNWFWGVFLVLAAGILITSQLGIFTYHIGFWTLLLAMFLVAAFVESLIHVAVGGMVFSLAFLAIIFAKPLGIATLAPWTILGAAVLLTAGLSLIIKPRWRWHHRGPRVIVNGQDWHHRKWHDYDWEEEDVQDLDASEILVNVNKSSSIRYLQSPDFKRAVIKVYMGSAKVYFDNVTVNPDGAEIVVDDSFGGTELFIPKHWNVHHNINAGFGTIEEKGTAEPDQTAPQVTIHGNVSFGGVTLIYV
ncbi:LiaF transmembrane domain-containing protein [Levilactobacillus angrenensis]|uniref:LiaF transmembrane domain-containing protein n=1 Tax=Levilactobacillus angrenensis TaxID=2486020 RepID=A0ABW1UA59_9LACO|nr:hypothetical protein [Levilactobacillus angrenensis]